MDSANSKSHGICQRLISLVFNMMSRPNVPRGSAEVPIEEGDQSRNGKKSSRPNGYSSSDEIVVEFRHILKESEGIKKKESNHLADHHQAIKTNKETREEMKPKPPRRVGPLLRVAPDINEKSDAYIQMKKKAMSRSLDPEKY